MTKVQLTFKLGRVLNETDRMQISRVHSVYGIFAVRVASTGIDLFVEYDASRLSGKEVRVILEQHGIPLAVSVAS